ncbi:MAG: glycosyltransferase [Bacteroidia bacterium]|nr:glycosyltransferase [Bacteroidia bacterium]
MMRVLLLSDTFSEHTEKWALGLASRGVMVGLFSFNKATYPWYANNSHIILLHEPLEKLDTQHKLAYLKFLAPLKKAIQSFQPDVLHAHYATSYGLLGALSKFQPFVISAWGTDVMRFPQKNVINRFILKYNLKCANVICATSNTIKNYLTPITSKPIKVIPFGVNFSKFYKKDVVRHFVKPIFVFGCIKSLESIYNIDVAIHAFARLKIKYPERQMKFMIIGQGSEFENLKKLTSVLNIQNEVLFTGRIPFDEVPNYFNQIDVLLNISNYESFGVSVIEAMACEKPVIATNTGGLKEIIENNQYGSLVEVGNIEQTVTAMESYLLNPILTEQVGKAAYEKVKQKYNWENNLTEMIEVYKQLIP